MAEALGLDTPILTERTPNEELLPVEEVDPEDEPPTEEPSGSVH